MNFGTKQTKIIDGYPYYVHSGYLSIDDFSTDQIAEVTTESVSEVRRIMLDNGIKKLSFGSPYSKEKNISFLKDFDFLEGLSISLDGFDFQPIYFCEELRELIVPFHYRGRADFTKFGQLESLYVDGRNKGIETVFQCKKLKHLSLSHFQDFSLQTLDDLKNIEFLSISDSAELLSLSGIEHLFNINELFIGNCTSLKEIDDIEHLRNIESVDLYKCNSIKSLEPLMHLKSLTRLNLDNMGDIPSIKFLAPLKNLKEFYMTEKTNVLDGDLGVLEELRQKGKLKNILFRNRHHYSHRAEDLGYKSSSYLEGIFGKRK